MIWKTPAALALIASLCGGQTLAAETFRQTRGRDISARFAGMEMTDEGIGPGCLQSTAPM